MGRIVKQVSETTTRYYWYPGDKAEWLRAAIAVGSGALAFAAVAVATDNALAAVVVGTSVTAAVAGCNFGRRDARALAALPEPTEKGGRRAAIAHAGRAAWRGVVEGVGAAGVAVLIVNLPADGVFGNWLLPLVPAAVGALAHQAGMLWERLGRASDAVPASRPVAEVLAYNRPTAEVLANNRATADAVATSRPPAAHKPVAQASAQRAIPG